MPSINYITSIVKVLETPTQKICNNKKFLNNKIPVTRFRAQLPQNKNTRVVNLICWGNLAKNVGKYYQANDYIMIEGYFSLDNKHLLNTVKQNSKKVEITVLKVYPFSNRLIAKK